MVAKLRCVVTNCISSGLPQGERGSLFCFPRNDDLRKVWLQNLCLQKLSCFSSIELVNRGYRVCYRHFEDIQFQTSLKTRLNFNAIPKCVINEDSDSLDIIKNRVCDNQSCAKKLRKTKYLLLKSERLRNVVNNNFFIVKSKYQSLEINHRNEVRRLKAEIKELKNKLRTCETLAAFVKKNYIVEIK